MFTIENIYGLFHTIRGRYEDAEFDIKQDFISFEAMVKIVASFLNGENDGGHLIIGIPEIKEGLNKGKPDFSNLKDMGFNRKDNEGQLFPVSIRSQEKGNKEKPKIYMGLENFRLELRTKISSWLEPLINFDELIHVGEIPYSGKYTLTGRSGHIIVISVRSNKESLCFHKQHRVYYGRIKKINADDYESACLPHSEMVKRMLGRHLSLESLGRPTYYDSIPAIPELREAFDYIYQGNTEKLIALIERMPTLKQMSDSEGNNILHIACLYGDITLVQQLVDEYKMSIYQTNHEGENPLLVAGYVGRADLVDYFLSKKQGLLSHQDRSGDNIFLQACCYNHVDLVIFLYERWPHLISSKNFDNKNALDSAVYGGAVDVVSLLLSVPYIRHYTLDDIESAISLNQYYNAIESSDSEEDTRILCSSSDVASSSTPLSLEPSDKSETYISIDAILQRTKVALQTLLASAPTEDTTSSMTLFGSSQAAMKSHTFSHALRHSR